jgi:hypothetical protein
LLILDIYVKLKVFNIMLYRTLIDTKNNIVVFKFILYKVMKLISINSDTIFITNTYRNNLFPAMFIKIRYVNNPNIIALNDIRWIY